MTFITSPKDRGDSGQPRLDRSKENETAAPFIRHAATRRELESARDDLITQGYDVLKEAEATTLLRTSTWGSVGIHVLVALLTPSGGRSGLEPRLAVIAHFTADQVMIKLDALAEPAGRPASA